MTMTPEERERVCGPERGQVVCWLTGCALVSAGLGMLLGFGGFLIGLGVTAWLLLVLAFVEHLVATVKKKV